MLKKPARYAQQLAYRLRQAGPRKTANVVLAELERRLRRTTLRSRPYFYYVDPCDACNLRCPLCATGNGTKHVKGMLSLDEYRAIFAKIAPYAVEVGLYSWGEPLLNKAIFAMIRHTADHGVRPILSSNLSVSIPNLGEQLVSAGTGKLIVSLDGTTAESYQRYRVRGDFELVLDNMRDVVAARRRLGSATPIVEWQFVVFKHNEHEREAASAMASELGVELRFASPFLPPERYGLSAGDEQLALEAAWMPSDQRLWDMNPALLRRRGYLFEGGCFFFYRSMFVTPDGGVNPCCFTHQQRYEFGNLLFDDLDAIWNNDYYRRSRALYAGRGAQPAGTLCDSCSLFQKPH